ncbi:RsfS/YbeB/iojap family protein [Sporobolomyces salmoneus]|uniref:RsfS/YbeB/iojap family protein n=1 Tax=Sporobolomyces salmoneus TaxID=183962 RepID=UPI0031751FA7
MLKSTQLARQCACFARTATRPISSRISTNLRTFTSTPFRLSSEDLPWFVDPSSAPSSSSSSSTSSSTLATAPIPTLPPPHLSRPLHPLHAYLSVSPFFDKDTLTYIHAREADPMGSWCDWVVICTLKEGRERGLRGAVEGVRTYLASNPVEFDSDSTDPLSPSSSNPSPFSPPATHPSIHGLPPTTASKHARSRARKGPPPTRQDQASGWALLDAGTLVVHVMTKEARKEYGDEIERVWNGVAKEEGVTTKREELEMRERESELRDNMKEVEEEMREEEERRIRNEGENVKIV